MTLILTHFRNTHIAQYKVNYNRQGVSAQLQDKLGHSARALLPQLHGFATLLNDSKLHSTDFKATADLLELEAMFSRLHGSLGHLTRDRPSVEFTAVSNTIILYTSQVLMILVISDIRKTH